METKEVNGGVISFRYEYFTGNSLAGDARKATAAVVKAYAQVMDEGGTTASNCMGSK